MAVRPLPTIQLGMGWFPEQSGGLNRYYLDLVRHLPEVGVSVAGLVTGSERVAVGSGGAVRSFSPSGASLPLRLRRVRALMRETLAHRAKSLVVTHFALYAAPCLDLLGDQPFAVHFHGPWAQEGRAEGANRIAARVKQWVEHSVYSRAARFIVLSRAFGKVLEERHAIPSDRIRVIPGGVDTQRFASELTKVEARQQLGWPTDRPIALIVRRLVRRMGLEDLIRGVAHARERVPDLLVLIAGSGPLTHELELRMAAESVEKNVRLLGFLPDDQLPLAYRAADLSVVPSVALEGFGLIVAESLAAGTPVLVTNVGGLPETIGQFTPEWIIAERGPRALGEAIAAALKGDLEAPSPDACARYARERFDWSVVTAQVRSVYDEVLQ